MIKRPSGWKVASKSGDVHIWEKTENGQKLRQFRFGNRRELTINTVVAEEQNVVEDVYEGGFTVWHGSFHAVSYFSTLTESDLNKLKGKRTIEIGCGNGVLGIYALLYLDAFEVFFQDLNSEVLEWCTQKNLELNEIQSQNKVKLIGGPWETCFDLIPMNTFSLILTSDTVYRVKHYALLHRQFDYLLDHDPTSRIFVSGKNFYFGNDGGILEFANFCRDKKKFSVAIVHQDDQQVPHTLLRLQRVSS
ncbi:hypothetical protein M3Y94_01002500 [Aphelenchoides besseyi]|nr:hypothetical protein M3Y94_01002500 [Aphelenchoides besseyi]KAI6220405.1 hypothetical protein M3Y95_01036600 [Aphelenchoides besseyi]